MRRLKVLLDKVLIEVVIASRYGATTRDYYHARKNVEDGLVKFTGELEKVIKNSISPTMFAFGVICSGVISSVVTWMLINGNF